jgi:hypothetical protein
VKVESEVENLVYILYKKVTSNLSKCMHNIDVPVYTMVILVDTLRDINILIYRCFQSI